MDNRVSVLAAKDYAPDLMDEIIAEHMAAHGMEDIISPASRVLIKPNLLAKYAPERAVTTQPELLAAVIRWLHNRGVRDIVIADSPGGPYTKGNLEGVYKASGLAKAAGEYGVGLNLGLETVPLSFPEGRVCREFTVIDPIVRADVIINLPRLKSHGMMMLSGAVKNLFGAVPGLQKPELHLRFQEQADFSAMLVDLALAVKPVIHIADAVVAMEGDGPAGGVPRHGGYTFAAKNPFALDLALCGFIKMPPEQVYTVAESIRRGLCPASPDGIKYLLSAPPEPLADFVFPRSRPIGFYGNVPSFLQGFARFLGDKVLAPLPVIKRKSCIGCGKCAESCAPEAAVVKSGKAEIDYNKCIKCFCCHEMCPVKAVDIRRARLWRF